MTIFSSFHNQKGERERVTYIEVKFWLLVITKERIIKPDFGKMHNGRKLVDGNLLIKREIVSGRII